MSNHIEQIKMKYFPRLFIFCINSVGWGLLLGQIKHTTFIDYVAAGIIWITSSILWLTKIND
jgi:hypothetical protein